MDLNRISQATLDSVVPRPFLEVVHEICDRVLEGAQERQQAANISAIDNIIKKYATRADERDSAPQSSTQ